MPLGHHDALLLGTIYVILNLTYPEEHAMSQHNEHHAENRPARESHRQDRQEEMLKEALERPGVREAVEVFLAWRSADHGLDPYRAATKHTSFATTTNHANYQ